MSVSQQPSPMFTIDLAQATARAQVGGKAFYLARALAVGVPVPAGFVIPCHAFAHFLMENGLTTQVAAYLVQAVSLRGQELRQAYEALCTTVIAAPVPNNLAQAVMAAADALHAGAPAGLAVRSSAVHEDGVDASFAGIYTSELGITTPTALWDAIRRGWCATWTPGALAYARRLKITVQPADMALLIQPVLPAASAGVIFTADPRTGNPWHFVINATWGLAQALMSGSAPADKFVVAWDTGEIVERQVAEKTTMLQTNEQGVATNLTPLAQQKDPALTDEQIRAVAHLALTLDRAFDRRVDVEWVVADDKVHVVQVRPLTALPTFFPHELSATEATFTWTPSDPVWYRPAKPGERLVAPFFHDRWALELWLRHSPGEYFPQQMGRERDFNGYRYQTPWQWGGTIHTPEEHIAWLTVHEADLQMLWLAQQRTMQETCQRTMQTRRLAQRAAELIPALLDLRAAEIDFMAATWGAPQWMIFTCEWLLKAFLKTIAPDFAIGRLLQGLPCLSQTRTEQAQALGRAIVEPTVRTAFIEQPLDQVLPYLVQNDSDCQFLHAYTAFCWQFGMCPPTWPAAWRGDDNQAQILLVIKKSLLGEGQDARTVRAVGAHERMKAETELRDRIAQVDATLLPRFQLLLTWAHFWTPQLDNRGWLAGFIHVRLLDLLRGTGELLVDEGILDLSTDLYLLTPEVLRQIANTADGNERRHLVQQRKQKYERNRRLTPPAFLGCPPEPLSAADGQVAIPTPDATPGTVLHGEGLAPGQVTGIARKTLDLNDATFLDSLTTDDIVVYPGYRTWPDWLSLFTVVKGVVTVQGVQLHHAAQIARECGVPYVNLSQHSWESIPEQATLTLDGAQGTVTIS